MDFLNDNFYFLEIQYNFGSNLDVTSTNDELRRET
jgi:hypothetical protein